ncbi:MAG: hypothetical protein WC379_08245 [Methanoregula sp.]|jgi:hypothetical protein
MKHTCGYSCISIAVVVFVAVSVLFAGCTTQSAGNTAPTVTVTPEQTALPASVATGTGTTSAALQYGVTLAYPDTWTRQDVLTSAVRDYGTTTINIANFYSPETIPGDSASYNTLSVDFDQSPGSNFEDYFNQATLAVGKTYGTPLGVSSHSYTMKVSGYKTYELDFQTTAVKGTYLFVSTENGMYIFSFRGPNQQDSVEALQGNIEAIIKSIVITPLVPDTTPHR